MLKNVKYFKFYIVEIQKTKLLKYEKATSIILKSLLGLILLILILLFTIPMLFRDKIKEKVEQVINESVKPK